MKKQNLVFILLLGIAVSYTSCKKKTLSDTENGTVKDEIVNADKNNNYFFDAVKSNFGEKEYYTVNNSKIYNLLINPFDKEDEKIFYQVYKIANNLKKSDKDGFLYKSIYQLVKNKKSNSLKYDELLNFNKNLKTVAYNGKTETYDAIKKTMIHKGLNYAVDIYIPNIKTADLNIMPIIAVGTDLYTNNDKLDDYIPAWYITNNGSSEEILINEKDALNSKKPVLIIGIYENNKLNIIENNKKIINSKKGKSTDDVNIRNVFLSNCKIAYRYERDNKSEFAFGYKVLSDDIGPYSEIINDEFIKIHKNNLNKVINVNKSLYPHTLYAKRVYGMTYERDWYVSNSNCHLIFVGGSPVWGIWCRMKYANEWYQEVNYLDLNNSSFKYIISKESVRFDWN